MSFGRRFAGIPAEGLCASAGRTPAGGAVAVGRGAASPHDRRWQVAIHEAAHATCAYLVGGAITAARRAARSDGFQFIQSV